MFILYILGALTSVATPSSGRRPLMSTKDVAAYLSVPLQTIYQWSYRGGGPPAMRVGRHLRYRPEEIEAWLDSNSTGPGATTP